MTHKLKILPRHFYAQVAGVKNFELRKDDREPRFASGDGLELFEWTPENGYSSEVIFRRVMHVLRDCEGLEPGYCIMATTPDLSPL